MYTVCSFSLGLWRPCNHRRDLFIDVHFLIKKMPPKSDEKGEVPVHTLNRSKCLQESKIRSLAQTHLGTGSYGSVFTYCSDRERKNSKCKYVLKTQTLGRLDAYLHEVFFHVYVQKNSIVPIVPKLHDHWICTNADVQTKESIGLGFMILDKWDGDVDHGQFDRLEREQMMDAFATWIPELVRLHVHHGDLHTGNILWRDTGKKIKQNIVGGMPPSRILQFALADWGLSDTEMNTKRLLAYYQQQFADIMENQ